jgi:serine/threonine protein phosphatase 1
MGKRTFAIGDIHGDLEALLKILGAFPKLTKEDTLLFVGDYIDRGPKSREVVEYVRRLGQHSAAKVVCLRGNHEDAWLRVIQRGWPEYVLPPVNGCLACMRSFQKMALPAEYERPREDEMPALLQGTFFPEDVVEWMRALPFWYEDDHAIYVHAGLPKQPDGTFPHPSKVVPQIALLWCREEAFFRDYRGKLVVFGHTTTTCLPPELSTYTPDDPSDIWAGPCVVGLDTGAGKGGFLTALELPAMRVYESRG